jgi:energy-coupling factor transporter transmembrane protein EcfT
LSEWVWYWCDVWKLSFVSVLTVVLLYSCILIFVLAYTVTVMQYIIVLSVLRFTNFLLMNFNNALSTNWLHYNKKKLLILAKNNSSKGIGHWNRFIERRNWDGLSLYCYCYAVHNCVICVKAITDWLCNYEQTPISIVIYKLCMCVLLFLKLWQVPREVSM